MPFVHAQRTAAAALLCAFLLGALPVSACPDIRNLNYSETQAKVAIEISRNLENLHFRKLAIDDDLSTRLLDAYLSQLDSQRRIFSAADLENFERYRYVLDDALKNGNLEPFYVVFNHYRRQLCALIQEIQQSLHPYVGDVTVADKALLLKSRAEEAWPANYQQVRDIWKKHLRYNVLSMKVSGSSDEEILENLRRRYEDRLHYIRTARESDTFGTFMNALTSLYDPHTRYLSPESYDNVNIHMSLHFDGIGVTLEQDGRYVKVVGIIKSGPADKQGVLKPADRIVAVGQGDSDYLTNVVGWNLDNIVSLIRGPRGTVVRLEIIPANAPNQETRKIIAIERNNVQLQDQAAESRILQIKHNGFNFDIGVITMPAFYMDFEAARKREKDYRSATRDMKRLLQELQEAQVDGVVVDLRGNRGGALVGASELTGLFIDKGAVTQIKDAKGHINREWIPSNAEAIYRQGPLLLLINRLSASAAEIFTAAIQDYRRGLVVGTPTYGKGTVQHFIALSRGYLKLTRSKFYRVSGESTQFRGVLPDIRFPALYDHTEIGEETLDNPLSWDRISPVPYETLHFPREELLPVLRKKHEKRTRKNPYFHYLARYADILAEKNKERSILLDEEEMRARKDADEERLLGMINQLRSARELPLFSSWEEVLEQGINVYQPFLEEEEQEDPLLEEAAYILADLVNLQYPKSLRTARRAGAPADS